MISGLLIDKNFKRMMMEEVLPYKDRLHNMWFEKILELIFQKLNHSISLSTNSKLLPHIKFTKILKQN